MKKKIAIFLMCVSLLCSVTACSQHHGMIQNPMNGFTVREVEPKQENPDEFTVTSSEWLPTSEEEIFSTSDLIAEIEILDSKECIAEKENEEGDTQQIYWKQYTAKIKNLFFSDDEYKDGDEITFISTCHSSYRYEQGILDILDGHEYVVFLHKIIDSGEKDFRYFPYSEIAPFSVRDPINNIIAKEDGEYLYPSIYTSLSSNEIKSLEGSRFTTRPLKSEKENNFKRDFENTLKKHGKDNKGKGRKK